MFFSIKKTGLPLSRKWWQTPATSRHMSHLVRLLPSGPDRVPKLSLRENQSLPLIIG